jgi:hypothetical protein
MSAFEKFESAKAKQKKEGEEAQMRSRAKFNTLDLERETLFKALKRQLLQFNNKVVDGHAIVVKGHKDNCELFADGTLYAVFDIERHSYSCACEGPCEHETSYWHTVSATTKSETEGDYGEYFGCTSLEEVKNDETFAEAMIKFLGGIDFRDI